MVYIYKEQNVLLIKMIQTVNVYHITSRALQLERNCVLSFFQRKRETSIHTVYWIHITGHLLAYTIKIANQHKHQNRPELISKCADQN